jgi:hypothetical protein
MLTLKLYAYKKYGKSHSPTLSPFPVSLLYINNGAKIEGVVLDFLSKVT